MGNCQSDSPPCSYEHHVAIDRPRKDDYDFCFHKDCKKAVIDHHRKRYEQLRIETDAMIQQKDLVITELYKKI